MARQLGPLPIYGWLGLVALMTVRYRRLVRAELGGVAPVGPVDPLNAEV